jgi:tripartite-type tricarboxylate transporter receptor subunit TctC
MVAADTPEQFREFIDAETRKWADVIRNAGVETTK